MDLDINDIRTKVNEIFELYNSKEEYNELYWCCQIWYLNNNDEEKKDSSMKKITELLNNHTLTNIHLNFFVTFSYYKTPLIVRELNRIIEFVIKIDMDGFLNNCHLNLFKYIVSSISEQI